MKDKNYSRILLIKIPMKELIQKHKLAILITVLLLLWIFTGYWIYSLHSKQMLEAQKPSEIEQVFIDIKDSRDRRTERNAIIKKNELEIAELRELNRQDAEIADKAKELITDLLINWK